LVPSKEKVAIIDQPSKSYVPGLYVSGNNNEWILAVPYQYVDNYITAGLESKIEVAPTVAATAPEGALLFKNGVLVSGQNITVGSDTWAWMLIDSISLPREMPSNQPIELEVKPNTWYPLTEEQVKNRVIRITGEITGGNANVQFPTGTTGVWYVDNQTTGTSTLAVSFAVVGSSGAIAYLTVGKSGFVYVSSNADNPDTVAILNPQVLSVNGKTGNVTLAVSDIDGAAPLDQPKFSGTVTINGSNDVNAGGLQVNGSGSGWVNISIVDVSNENGASLLLQHTEKTFLVNNGGGLQVRDDAHENTLFAVDKTGFATVYKDQTTYTPQSQELITKGFFDQGVVAYNRSLTVVEADYTTLLPLRPDQIKTRRILFNGTPSGDLLVAFPISTDADAGVYTLINNTSVKLTITGSGGLNATAVLKPKQAADVTFAGDGNFFRTLFTGAPTESPDFTGMVSVAGTVEIGAKTAPQQLQMGMTSTLARMSERVVGDRLSITTNVDLTGAQDSATVPSWEVAFGGSEDKFAIGRTSAGSSTAQQLPPLLWVDGPSGQIYVPSGYVPSSDDSLVNKKYVDGKTVASLSYVGAKHWISSPWITTQQWTQMIPYGVSYPEGAPGFQFITNENPPEDMILTFGIVSSGIGNFDSPTIIGTIKIPAGSVTPDTSQFVGKSDVAAGTLLVVNCNIAQPFSFALLTRVWNEG
jgi:hypothetical protein